MPPKATKLIPAALLLALSSTAAALAQERPPIRPTRDVDVTYRTEQDGQVIEQRYRFAAAADRSRLDTATPGLYMLVDYRAHTMSLVSDPDRGAVDLPFPAAGNPPGAAPTAGATRRGQDQVAGTPCTEWELVDTRRQTVLTCFTADGVMLRSRLGNRLLAVATRLAYGPVDPAITAIPAGYGHATKRAP